MIFLLFLFKLSFATTVYVSDNGSQKPCGSLSTPCASISTVLSDSSVTNIIIIDVITTSSSLDLSSITLNSNISPIQAEVKVSSTSGITNTKSLFLNDIVFTFANSAITSQFITSANLSLNHITFTPELKSITQKTIEFKLLYMTRGKLEATNLTIEFFTFTNTNTAIFLETYVSASFTNLSLSSLTMSNRSAICFASSTSNVPAEIAINSASIVTLYATNVPALLSCSQPTDWFPVRISLTNASLAQCTSSFATGGAIRAPLASGGALSLSDCQFIHCSCSSVSSETTTRGGGVYVDAYGDSNRGEDYTVAVSFSLSNCTFRNNYASIGNDMYFQTGILTKQLSGNMFHINVDLGFDAVNAIYGISLDAAASNVGVETDLVNLLGITVSASTQTVKKDSHAGEIAALVILSVCVVAAVVFLVFLVIKYHNHFNKEVFLVAWESCFTQCKSDRTNET